MTWTREELIAVSASRLLADGKNVFAGVGMPLLASVLAKETHAPLLTIILEGGIIGPRMIPGNLPVSTNEMRAAYRSRMLTDIVDIFLFAQRGFFDYGILGTAQIDRYGNINTTLIGEHKSPKVRLPGTGGANDIISACREVFVMTMHEPRRFVEKVDFITSPGYLDGGNARKEAGLIFGEPRMVVTDLALMDFEPETKHIRVKALQPKVSIEEVKEMTAFDVLVADDIEELAPPTTDELEILRRLDPKR